MLNVKAQRLSDTAILPTYGSAKAACMDLYADLGFVPARFVDGVHQVPDFIYVAPHTTAKIGCGFAFQPPEGYAGFIYARSGLSTKQGLRPANCVGVCDEDYTGEYLIPIYNDSDEERLIHHGDRIAQLIFMPYEQANLIEVDELDSTERGDGGFGSTGK